MVSNSKWGQTLVFCFVLCFVLVFKYSYIQPHNAAQVKRHERGKNTSPRPAFALHAHVRGTSDACLSFARHV